MYSHLQYKNSRKFHFGKILLRINVRTSFYLLTRLYGCLRTWQQLSVVKTHLIEQWTEKRGAMPGTNDNTSVVTLTSPVAPAVTSSPGNVLVDGRLYGAPPSGSVTTWLRSTTESSPDADEWIPGRQQHSVSTAPPRRTRYCHVIVQHDLELVLSEMKT